MLERADTTMEEKVNMADEEAEAVEKDVKEILEGRVRVGDHPGVHQDQPQLEEGALLEEVDEEHDVEMVDGGEPPESGMAGACGGLQGTGGTSEHHAGRNLGVQAHCTHR